jgi:hypothetical protein
MFQHRKSATLPTVSNIGGKERGFSLLIALLLICILAPSALAATKLTLVTSGGIAIAGVAPAYTSTFGTMNALGIGAAQAGVTSATSTTGALYFTTLSATIAAIGPNTAVVKARVTTNFIGSAASAMVVYGCPSSSACNSSAQFSPLAITPAAEATLASGITTNGNNVVGLAVFLPDNNGASSFTGAGSVTVTFDLYLNGSVVPSDTVTLALLTETVQDAVQLNLAQSGTGLAVAAGSDFSMGFGNVNALGINPRAGLTTSSQAGGIIYQTPYNLLPAFADFSSPSATIKVCVSKTFTHSTILVLEKSSTGSSGSFSNISTSCSGAGPDTLTSSAADRSTLTQYLGLFVSNVNGATAFTGLDTATLTYTLTVP